jgi:hypothetical protein
VNEISTRRFITKCRMQVQTGNFYFRLRDTDARECKSVTGKRATTYVVPSMPVWARKQGQSDGRRRDPDSSENEERYLPVLTFQCQSLARLSAT